MAFHCQRRYLLQRRCSPGVKGLQTGGPQPLGDVMRQLGCRQGQPRGHAPAELILLLPGLEVGVVLHGRIPLAFSALLRAWTAREQCVLTLPSEQPMAAAVSATS